MVQEVMTAGIMGGLSKTTSMREKIVSDTLDAVADKLETRAKLKQSKALAKALRSPFIADADTIRILDSCFKDKDKPGVFHLESGKIRSLVIHDKKDRNKIVKIIQAQVEDDFTGKVEVSNWKSGKIDIEVIPKSSRKTFETQSKAGSCLR